MLIHMTLQNKRVLLMHGIAGALPTWLKEALTF
jgi:hypothetical protein